ncbi:hypothetical protein GCM10011534_42410 [Pseudooceanicola nanhaiensis]|jgi:tripartite-type tricarboxylate transporter receptor subunit TctC|uniref:Tripartite tricarboxylate transporter substrate binding protein n=1 Tax=Pseudooceanicola nanhaiensis TaxID=375761 RepID=A0A917TAK7_9RHOB|nr:hypothetical protein GCM10011534_42410 [Pseudooceanicola nanhaiensis]
MRFLAAALAALGLTAGSVASADDFPSRPVSLIVPYAPGGSQDTIARLLADELGRQLGGTVVVENKTGGGTTVGHGFVARSKPDGYTLILSTPAGISVAPYLRSDMTYDPFTDLVPVALLNETALAFAVAEQSEIANFPALMAKIKAGDRITFGSAGIGSSGHLVGELFNVEAGASMVHVPYGGSGPAFKAVLDGEVNL